MGDPELWGASERSVNVRLRMGDFEKQGVSQNNVSPIHLRSASVRVRSLKMSPFRPASHLPMTA